MTHPNPFITQLFNKPLLLKRMMPGAIIGLLLICAFLFIPDYNASPSWPKYWMVRPLIIVPLAGAMGGLFYHFMHTLSYYKGWNTIIPYLVSFIVFMIGLWLGFVLGLDGTLWN